MATVYLTKSDLIKELSEELGITKKNMTVIYDAMDSKLNSHLIMGKTIKLFSLGTLKVAEKAARQCYIPSRKEKMSVPVRKGLKFKQKKSTKF